MIEKRVKEALEEFLVLPKMEDVPFWSSEGMGGLFCCSNDEESITGESFSSNSRGGSVDATAVAVAAISATTSSAEDSFKHTPSVVKSASLEPLVSDSMRASRDNLTANDGEEGPIAVVEKNKQRGARTSLESSRTPTTAVTTTAVKADTESSTTLNSSDQQQLRKFVALKRGESLPTTPTPTAASTSGVSSTIDYLSKTAITYGLDDRAKQLLSKAQEYGLDKSAESLIGKAKEYGLDGRMKYISNWIEKAGILPSHQIKPVVVEPTTASDATSTTTPTPPLSIMPPSSGGDLLELDVAIISKHSSGSSPIMAATTGNYQQITSSTTKSCEIAAKVLDEILDDALTLLVSSKTVDELPVESVEKAGEVKIDRMADIDDSSHRADKGTQTPPPHLDTTEVVVSNGDGTGKMGAFELKERLLTSFAEELLVRYSPNDSAAATVAATTVAFESTSHHLAHEDDNNSSLLNLQGSGSLSSTGLLLLEDHTSENDLSAMEPMLMMEDVFEQVEEDVYVIQNNISDRDDIGLYNNPLRRQVIPTVHHHHAGDEWINSSTSLSIAGDDGLYSESGYKKEEDEEEGDAEDMELDVINIKSTIVPTTLATTTPILPASHEGEIKPSSTSLLSTKGAVSAITSLTGFSSLLSYQQSLRNVFNDISHIVNNPTPQLRLVNPAALESEEELDGETVPALVVASSSNSTTPSSSLHSSPERRY